MSTSVSSTFWGDSSHAQSESLKENTTAAFLIVGGGIAGLSAAYFLLEQGQTDIVLIDQGAVGSGSTGHSAGMLVCEPETSSWAGLVARYSHELVRHYWDAQVAAQKIISDIAREEHIECDFMIEELLILAGTSEAESHILGDFGARQSMKNRTTLLSGSELAKEFRPEAFVRAERIEGAISVNPLLFARGFAKYLKRRGVRIYEYTPLLSARRNRAQTPLGVISYKNMLRCMGTYEKKSVIDRYLTTISVTRTLAEHELRYIGLADRDMFFDQERRSFHYGKITVDNRLLIGYGDTACIAKSREHTAYAPHVRNIARFLERAFPRLRLPIEYSWSAEYALSKSDVPVVRVVGGEVIINGAGTQLASIVASSNAVSRLLGKNHPLDALFIAKSYSAA